MVPKGTKMYTKISKGTKSPKEYTEVNNVDLYTFGSVLNQNLLGHIVSHHQRQGKAKSCNKGF